MASSGDEGSPFATLQVASASGRATATRIASPTVFCTSSTFGAAVSAAQASAHAAAHAALAQLSAFVAHAAVAHAAQLASELTLENYRTLR
jgi:hypothetical protein